MNRGTDTKSLLRQRVVIAAVLLVLLGAVWWLHGALLSVLVQRVLPGLGGLAGCELQAGEVQAQFFVPWVLKDVEVRRPDGTEVRIGQATLSWDGSAHPGSDARRWLGRLVLEDVSGSPFVHNQAPSPTGGCATGEIGRRRL